MIEGNTNGVVPETDITAMKEALCAQQQLLQQLYAELDVEREASATAVSEALSMILRLQEEKSAVLMEANQYKRMAEEKISHSEESMANFEELMYQKEMEIASLEFQVQAFKCKLLSMGWSDVVEMGETKFENNLLLPGNNSNNNSAMARERGVNQHVRRLQSLPPLQLKDSGQSRRRRSMTPESDAVIKTMEQAAADNEMNDQSIDLKKNQEKFEGGDLDSYWEQIRKLDERVKKITDRSTGLKVESRTSSLISQSLSSIYDAGQMMKTKGDQVKDLKMLNEKEAFGDSACSSNIYDVFEVPQVNDSRKICLKKKEEEKITWFPEEENRLGKPDLGIKETSESHFNNENELVKKLFLANQDKGLCRMREGSIDCTVAIVQPEFNITEIQPETQEPSQRIERVEPERTSTSHDIAPQREEGLPLLGNSVVQCGPEFQHPRQRIGQLEVNRNSTRHEIVDEGREELILLREIREQINSIQDEIRCLRRKKPSPHNNPAILSIQEAMLHFWI